MKHSEIEKILQLSRKALAKLRANGTLQQIQQKWLSKATGAPVLK